MKTRSRSTVTGRNILLLDEIPFISRWQFSMYPFLRLCTREVVKRDDGPSVEAPSRCNGRGIKKKKEKVYNKKVVGEEGKVVTTNFFLVPFLKRVIIIGYFLFHLPAPFDILDIRFRWTLPMKLPQPTFCTRAVEPIRFFGKLSAKTFRRARAVSTVSFQFCIESPRVYRNFSIHPRHVLACTLPCNCQDFHSRIFFSLI